VITSPRNRAVVAALALRTRKHREEGRRFLVEGPTSVTEAARAGAVETLFVTADGAGPRMEAGKGIRPETHLVSPAVMRRLAGTVTPRGPVAVCRFVDLPLDALDPATGPIVVLVEVRDPGNAGTILRAAHAAGCGGVIVSARSVDVYNEKAARASAGALFHVPFARDVEPEAAIAALRARGATVLAASAAGERDLYDDRIGEALAGPVGVLFGNEAHGLDEAVGERSDAVVRIPMREGAESLNLAAAAAVILFEAARRRRPGPARART
jgi:TrmH family RNA methyltransferase